MGHPAPGSEPDDVLHRVESRGPSGHEAYGAQGAAREGVAAVRAMSQLQALTQGTERYRMLAHHIARAHREDADLLRRALPGQPLTAVHGDLAEITPQRLRHDLGQALRGSAGSVLLV